MNTGIRDADAATAGRMYIPADDLCREGIVDELTIMGSAGMDLTRWRVLSRDKVKLTTWTNIHGKTYEASRPKWAYGLQAMFRNPTSHGTCFHELANVIYLNMWHDIEKALPENQAAAN